MQRQQLSTTSPCISVNFTLGTSYVDIMKLFWDVDLDQYMLIKPMSAVIYAPAYAIVVLLYIESFLKSFHAAVLYALYKEQMAIDSRGKMGRMG